MKKILIALLAAVTLFSFASCDNSNSNTGTGSQLDIAYIEGTVKNAKDYLVGDTPDPADFTFTGYDAAGNVVIENISSTLFTSSLLDSTTDEATFTYNGLLKLSVEVPVDVYAVDDYTLTVGDNVEKTYYTVVTTNEADTSDYKVVDTNGLTVTATYDGTKTRNITNFTATIDNWTTANPAAEVSVKVGTTEVGKYSVALLENAVESIYFDVTDDYTIWYDEGKTADTATISSNDVKLYGKMLNGQTGYTLTGTATYSLTNIQNATFGDFDDLKIGTTDTSVTVYAKYTGTDIAPNYDVDTVVSTASIPVKEDSKIGIKVAVEEGETVKLAIDTDYSADAETKQNEIKHLTVSYTLASGKAGSNLTLNAEKDGYTISPATFENLTPRKNYPVTITAGDWTTDILVELVATAAEIEEA